MAHQLQEQTQGRASSSEFQIQVLREELDTANKKVDRYVHLLASLYEELDNLRKSICHNCKIKFVPSYAPVASFLDGSGRCPMLCHPTVSGRQTLTPSAAVLSTITGKSSHNASIPVRFITAQQNQTNPSILDRPQASSSIPTQPSTTPGNVVSGRPTQAPSSRFPLVLPKNTGGSPNVSIPVRSITTQHNQTYLATLARSQVPSSTPIPTQPSTVGEIESNHPKWSVSHNPDIKQSLQIDLVKTFNFTARVCCAKFSPNGKYLAVGLNQLSGKTYVYDVEKGVEICCCLVDLYLNGHQRPLVWCIQFSPDNKYIATASDKIRIWEIARKRTRAEFTHSASESLCFSPNGRFFVAGGYRVRIWSLRDGSSKTLLDNVCPTFSITFSPDGQHIASVDISGLLRIWDVRTGQLLDAWTGHTQEGVCVAFSPDGKGLVSGSGDGILRYWDVGSLADMEMGRDRVIGGNPGQKFQQIRIFKLEGHSSWIRSASFSPGFQWVATSSHDKSVRIWNPQTAEWQCTLHGHDAYALTVDFSPAGEYLASGGDDQRVRLWRYSGV